MRRLCIRSSNNRGPVGVSVLLLILGLLGGIPSAVAADVPSESALIRFRVVAVNPSETKTQQVPIRYYLPQEVTPKDILDLGDLELEYDDTQSCYLVQKSGVELAPRETKVFEVVVRDVWIIPAAELNGLERHAQLLLGRLEKTPYYETAKPIADSVAMRIAEIKAVQVDETLSRKRHIGAYRINRLALDQIKEDLARMEKLLTFTGGPPIPEMLEESPLKSDAPSTKTTWLLIGLIIIFVGLLGGIFFFTWHRRAQATHEFSDATRSAFPASSQPSAPDAPDAKGRAA